MPAQFRSKIWPRKWGRLSPGKAVPCGRPGVAGPAPAGCNQRGLHRQRRRGQHGVAASQQRLATQPPDSPGAGPPPVRGQALALLVRGGSGVRSKPLPSTSGCCICFWLGSVCIMFFSHASLSPHEFVVSADGVSAQRLEHAALSAHGRCPRASRPGGPEAVHCVGWVNHFVFRGALLFAIVREKPSDTFSHPCSYA